MDQTVHVEASPGRSFAEMMFCSQDFGEVVASSSFQCAKTPLVLAKTLLTPTTISLLNPEKRVLPSDGDVAFPAFMEHHNKEKLFTCEFCHKSFTLKSSLNVHRRIHTGECPYKCDVCAKTFRNSGTFVKHTRTHTDEKPFVCSVCLKGFARPSYLKKHAWTHTKEKPFSCNLCQKSFAQRGSLSVHMRVHTGERPYSCDICKKTFVHSSTLVAHIRTHNPETPYYSCDICPKAFNTKWVLKSHKRTHTGEKPFLCEICKKSFSNKSNLKRHLSTHLGQSNEKSPQLLPVSDQGQLHAMYFSPLDRSPSVGVEAMPPLKRSTMIMQRYLHDQVKKMLSNNLLRGDTCIVENDTPAPVQI